MADFESLREQRNKEVQESTERLATRLGVPADSLLTNFDPASCYCDCANGGPCEHKWDGEPYESDDDGAFVSSATCSLCGCVALNHDLHNFD